MAVPARCAVLEALGACEDAPIRRGTAQSSRRDRTLKSKRHGRAQGALHSPRLSDTISRVSDTWPPPGPQQRELLLEHVQDVWTLRYIETNCTAAIWRNEFG